MKIAIAFLAVVVCMVGVAVCAPTTTGCDCCNCPDVYEPVCATDDATPGNPQRTFKNLCEMNCYNLHHNAKYRVLHNGPCDCPGKA